MKVTTKWLKEQGACAEGIMMFKEIHGKSAELKDVINYGIKSKDKTKLQYCNWLIVKKMNHEQQIKYAIYAAERVLHIFEEKHPNNKRPRKAIESAIKYLKLKTKDAAADAAPAAYAAADAAYAAHAAYAAAYAAYAAADAAASAAHAAYAAYAAASAAAHAAHAAYAAAYAADAAADAAAYAAPAAYAALKIKVLKYGLKIMGV